MGVCNQFPLELDDEPLKNRPPSAPVESDEEPSDDDENVGLDEERLAEEMELPEELGLDRSKFQFCCVNFPYHNSSYLVSSLMNVL